MAKKTPPNCVPRPSLALFAVDAVPLTQKLLVNAGGWPALKKAQLIQQAGRVVEFDYAPPLLTGFVREGTHNLRSGLRIKTFSDVENLCTCRESRAWGKICGHSLAVGLAYLARGTTPPAREPAARPAAVSTPPSGPRLVEEGAEAGAQSVAFHFILPPNFESAWAKNQIMLVTEVQWQGKRVMPSMLGVKETYACDTHDLAVFNVLLAPTPMRMLTRAEFLATLPAWRGHPRLTFGKAPAVSVASEPGRLRIRLQQNADESLSLAIAKNEGRLLVAGRDACVWRGATFVPLPDDFPPELAPLAESPITFRKENAARFLALLAPQLARWCEIETPPGWTWPTVQVALPKIRLQLEGSLREVRAVLQAQYPDGARPITERIFSEEPTFLRDATGTVLLRDTAAERAALVRLEALGFILRRDVLVLANDENRIARFFAFELPRLKNEWEVQLSAQASKADEEVQPLAPRLEMVGSGEDWFELRYSLGTPGGELFSAAELQRLLRSGQSKVRLKNGRTAVFDPAAINDLEEVLRDCEPRQSQPGVYRIDRSHASYMSHTAEDLGFHLQQLTQPIAALPALDLGDLREKLRAYQTDGVQWLARLAQNKLGGILADEMGLGKTVQMLAFLRAQAGPEPALIVCPTSLLANWRNEAKRFTPELRVLLLDGPDRHARFPEIAESDLVLTSYALLQRDAARYRALAFSTVVLDEAQHIKNPDTQNAQAAFSLRARQRFVLTGTPMENSVRDIWSLMNFVLPGYLGARADFRERYEQPLARGEAPEVQRRLARRLRPFLLRRKKSEVAKDLPEKIEQPVLCDLSAPQRAAYDGLLREIQSGLSSAPGPNAGAQRMKMLVGLLRLRQTCCDLRLLGPEASATFPSAKLDLLDELLEEAIDGGHRVLVFSQFVAMLRLIRERLDAQGIRFCLPRWPDAGTPGGGGSIPKRQRHSRVPDEPESRRRRLESFRRRHRDPLRSVVELRRRSASHRSRSSHRPDPRGDCL